MMYSDSFCLSRGPISSSINSFIMSAARLLPSFTLSRRGDSTVLPSGDGLTGAVGSLRVSTDFGNSVFLLFGSLSSRAGSAEKRDGIDPLGLGIMRRGDMPGPR